MEPEAEDFCDNIIAPVFFQIECISEETMTLLEVAVLSVFFWGEEAGLVSRIFVVIFTEVAEAVFIDMDISWTDGFFPDCWSGVVTISDIASCIFPTGVLVFWREIVTSLGLVLSDRLVEVLRIIYGYIILVATFPGTKCAGKVSFRTFPKEGVETLATSTSFWSENHVLRPS